MNIVQQASPPQALQKPPFRPISYALPAITAETAPDGVVLLRSRTPLEPHDPSLANLFRAAVAAQPERLFLAERNPGGDWRRITYAEARATVDAVAQSLLDRALSASLEGVVISAGPYICSFLRWS